MILKIKRNIIISCASDFIRGTSAVKGSIMVRIACLALIIFTFCPENISAQEMIVLSKLESAISFDGVCNDDAWNAIGPLPLFTFFPDYGREPFEKTLIRVAYDNDYLYLGAVMHDSNPEKMKVQIKRDHFGSDCDYLFLVLDTFNDKENSLVFATSPNGGRTDLAFFNDGTSYNTDWNTFWDVKVTRDQSGWQSEMRIPFSSLRFNDENGEVVMGIGVGRYLTDRYELYTMPQVQEKYGTFGMFRATQTSEALLNSINSSNPVYITPYIVAGLDWSNKLNPEGTDYDKTLKKNLDAGLDAKLRVSNNLTLDLTVNTDFAQVEDDNIRVNLTRFPLFYPEKRQFFQERNSNFLFNFMESDRLFHSRRIGLSGGLPVQVYGGARLVGMAGKWDIGFLSMQTGPAGDLKSENFSVFRLSRQVMNEESEIGGILTSRMDFRGHYNYTAGLDGLFHVFGDDYLKLMWAQTVENVNDRLFTLDQSQFLLNWRHRTNKGILYNLNLNRAGASYNPGLGFQSRNDYSRARGSLGYGWIYDKAWIKSHNLSIIGDIYVKNIKRYMESSLFVFDWYLESRSGLSGDFLWGWFFDYLLEEFNPYPEISVQPGKYTDFKVSFVFSSPQGKTVGFNGDFYTGGYYGGSIFELNASPTCFIRNTVRLTATYTFDRVKFPDQNEVFDSHILRLRSELVFGTRLSMSAFMQYSNTSKLIPVNVRFRYNPREGNDLYIIYDEGFNSDRFREIPVFPVSKMRTVMLKYTYTFIL